MRIYCRSVPVVLLCVLLPVGCENDVPSRPGEVSPSSASSEEEKKPAGTATPAAAGPRQVGGANPPAAKAAKPGKRVRIGKSVYFERLDGDRRRVVVDAAVCLREGMLELFLCRKGFKEHEAILAADVDARDIHTGLVLAGAKPGSPLKYVEKNGQEIIVPPTGQKIKVSVQYEDKGKTVTTPAQRWVRYVKTRKDLDSDWIFAGSVLIPDEDKNRPPLYAANYGDVICVANFPDALLDLPLKSSKDNPELLFEPHTERIPPLDTSVLVILEPIPDKKK